MAKRPLVRVIVVNYDAGAMALECLDSLRDGSWPLDRLDVVLVDNGSLDGVVDQVRAERPEVTVYEPLANLGFAGGSNLGLLSDGNPDFVALLNPDAAADPDWLEPLVTALEADPGLGAMSPKMVFAQRTVDLQVSTSKAGRLGDIDDRILGVRLIDASWADGDPEAPELKFGVGWYHSEETISDEHLAVWSSAEATLTLAAETAAGRRLHLTFRRPEPTGVTITSGNTSITAIVGPEPISIDVDLPTDGLDVIQNAGSRLYSGGYGGDRGFRERDCGQYDVAEEIPAWCGGAVLLRQAYLDDVGLFDDRFFLYYEDLDLSWRGRLRGWRYGYEPRSKVCHHHAQSTGEWAPLFRYQVDRNRLLTLIKNAPGVVAVEEWGRAHARLIRAVLRDVIRPLCRIRMPQRTEVVHHCRVLRGAWRQLPGMLRHRWTSRRTVSRRTVYRTAEART